MNTILFIIGLLIIAFGSYVCYVATQRGSSSDRDSVEKSIEKSSTKTIERVNTASETISSRINEATDSILDSAIEMGHSIEEKINSSACSVREMVEQNSKASSLRQEFMLSLSRPLVRLCMMVRLNRDYTPHELGHFRLMCQILDIELNGTPWSGIWIAGRDAYDNAIIAGRKTPVVGVANYVWTKTPDYVSRAMVVVGAAGLGAACRAGELQYSLHDDASYVRATPQSSAKVSRLGAGRWINGKSPFSTIGDLTGKSLTLYVTTPLVEKIDEIIVVANEYIIVRGMRIDLIPKLQNPPFQCHMPLSDEEMAVSSSVILARDTNQDTIDSGLPNWRNWSLDFSKYTPSKFMWKR